MIPKTRLLSRAYLHLTSPSLEKRKREEQLAKAKEDATKEASGDKGSIGEVKRKGAGKAIPGSVKRVNLDMGAYEPQLESNYGVIDPDWPDKKNKLVVTFTICPCQWSPWKNSHFNFKLDIPGEYPYVAPKATCLTRVYHPNIDLQGNVCLNILRMDWNPTYDLTTIFSRNSRPFC